MSKKKVIPRKRGAGRMYQLGNKAVSFWLDPVEVRMVADAFSGRPFATVAKELLLTSCNVKGIYRHHHADEGL